MSEQNRTDAHEMLEECIDELDKAIEGLQRFPPEVLAFALRAHLAALLRSLTEAGQLGAQPLADFLAGLEAEVLQTEPDDNPHEGAPAQERSGSK
jgi:hypothetical protein